MKAKVISKRKKKRAENHFQRVRNTCDVLRINKIAPLWEIV